jgi:hypothetical protein
VTVFIAAQWLNDMARSTNEQDFDSLLDLLSDHIRLLGDSEQDTVDQEEWVRQRKLQFEGHPSGLLSYTPPQMTANLPGRLMFRTVETIETRNGTHHRRPLEIIIQQEEDGKWRALQQRPLPETSHRHKSPRALKA